MNATEAAGDVVLKEVNGDDVVVFLKPSNATYRFKNVPKDVLESFQGMLKSGGGFNALRYLQKHAGKGVRESADMKTIADRILDGEDIDKVLDAATPETPTESLDVAKLATAVAKASTGAESLATKVVQAFVHRGVANEEEVKKAATALMASVSESSSDEDILLAVTEAILKDDSINISVEASMDGKSVLVILTGEPMENVKMTMKQAGIPGQYIDFGMAPGGNVRPKMDTPSMGAPFLNLKVGDPVVRPNNEPKSIAAPGAASFEYDVADPKSTMQSKAHMMPAGSNIPGQTVQPGTPNYGAQSPRTQPAPAGKAAGIPGQSVPSGTPAPMSTQVAMIIPGEFVTIVKDKYPSATLMSMEQLEPVGEQFGATKLRCANGGCAMNTSGMCQSNSLQLSTMGVCQTQQKRSTPKYPGAELRRQGYEESKMRINRKVMSEAFSSKVIEFDSMDDAKKAHQRVMSSLYLKKYDVGTPEDFEGTISIAIDKQGSFDRKESEAVDQIAKEFNGTVMDF